MCGCVNTGNKYLPVCMYVCMYIYVQGVSFDRTYLSPIGPIEGDSLGKIRRHLRAYKTRYFRAF